MSKIWNVYFIFPTRSLVSTYDATVEFCVGARRQGPLTSTVAYIAIIASRMLLICLHFLQKPYIFCLLVVNFTLGKFNKYIFSMLIVSLHRWLHMERFQFFIHKTSCILCRKLGDASYVVWLSKLVLNTQKSIYKLANTPRECSWFQYERKKIGTLKSIKRFDIEFD